MPIDQSESSSLLRLALPKGRMQDGVFALLNGAGINLRVSGRGYRPHISLPGIDVKILKPQNVIEMLCAGSRDVGFAGADWVSELDGDLVELLDTGLDSVRLVAAAPAALLIDGRLPQRPLVIASEYERLTQRWIKGRELNASFVRSYGATEVFPPEDADCVVDITASGETLRAQNLTIFDTLLSSSTRLYANRAALNDPTRRTGIDRLVLLLASVLEARKRVMLEVNVSPRDLNRLTSILPCMREPTVSQLHGGGGFALKVAVPRAQLPLLIPDIKSRGGTDIVVTEISQLIP